MSLTIVHRPKKTIAGLSVETLLKDTREPLIIPKLQQAFNGRIGEIQGSVGLPNTYGVFIDLYGVKDAYGMKEFAIIDPDGYTIGFGESLHDE